MQKKIFILTLIFYLLFNVPEMAQAQTAAPRLTKTDIVNIITLADNGSFSAARMKAFESGNKDLIDLIVWMQYQETASDSNYSEIQSFIQTHPTWPNLKILKNRSENALNESLPDKDIVEYFKQKKPITGRAMRLLAEAKKSLGYPQEEVNELLRQGWIQGDFTTVEEEQFLQKHVNALRDEDHVKRIDRLLWEEKIPEAKRLFYLVNSDYKTLFASRIMLMQSKHYSNMSIAKIPQQLRRDPGLLYENIRWYEQRENYEREAELMLKINITMPYQEKWWKLKNRVVRELLEDRQYNNAYLIAKNSGNTMGTPDFAESEWLAGWIALRFRNETKVAYTHFYNAYNSVEFPVSKARAAYWAGRAAEKNRNNDIAKNWYSIAASHPTTFYGQLAMEKTKTNNYAKILGSPNSSQDDMEIYKNNKLVKIAIWLLDANEERLAEKFIIAAIENAKTPGEMALIGKIGDRFGKKELSVIAAKAAIKKDVILNKAGWPKISGINSDETELPLTLAIIRQESNFNPTVRSSANAIGLMQLIPATAKRMAKDLNLKFSESRLLNPSYNSKLGSHYIKTLIDNFGGSYILAIASYNAGPGNIKKWLDKFGDPRKMNSTEEIIDWIELIPFSETRNYVQRVLENTQVYRYIGNKETFGLGTDLARKYAAEAQN